MISSDGTTFTMAAVNTETTSALFSQLAQLLAVGTREDGKYHLADFCQANSINMWSKKHPFAYNSENFDYNPNNPSASNNERAKQLQLANYGITIPSTGYGDAATMAKDVYEGKIAWTYNKPRGRDYGEPLRLRDFDGYYAVAKPPLNPSQGDYTTTSQTSTTNIAPLFEVAVSNDKQIALTDLRLAGQSWDNTFAKMYVGLCCYNTNTQNTYYTIVNKTYEEYLEETKNNEIGFGVDVAAPSSTNATYTYFCFPFFCSTPTGTTFHPVPVSSQNITVKRIQEGKVSYYISSFILQGTTSPLYYRAYIYNGTANSKTMTYRILPLSSSNKNDVISSVTNQFPSGTITVPAGGVAYIPDENGGKFTDGLYINQINYMYCELKQGEAYVGEGYPSEVIRNAAPEDPPYYPYEP